MLMIDNLKTNYERPAESLKNEQIDIMNKNVFVAIMLTYKNLRVRNSLTPYFYLPW